MWWNRAGAGNREGTAIPHRKPGGGESARWGGARRGETAGNPAVWRADADSRGVPGTAHAGPLWHLGELQLRVGRPFDGIDADTVLACIAPLLLNVSGRDGSRRHDEDQELHRIDGIGNLFPPADTTLEKETVLSNQEVGCLASKSVP
jgi:hypothetical protein